MSSSTIENESETKNENKSEGYENKNEKYSSINEQEISPTRNTNKTNNNNKTIHNNKVFQHDYKIIICLNEPIYKSINDIYYKTYNLKIIKFEKRELNLTTHTLLLQRPNGIPETPNVIANIIDTSKSKQTITDHEGTPFNISPI